MGVSVGGIQFQGFREVPQITQLRLSNIERPGLSGMNFHFNGVGGQEYELTAYCDYTSAANRNSAITAIRNLCGTRVAVLDKDGTSFGYHMLKAAAPIAMPNYVLGVGGKNNGRFWLEIKLTLVPIGTSL